MYKLMSECVHAHELAAHAQRLAVHICSISAARACTQKQYASLRISACIRSEFVRKHTLTHTY
jgi:hypothetical protein